MDEGVGSQIPALDVFRKIAFRRGEVPPIHGGRAFDRGGLPKLLQLRPIEVYITAGSVSGRGPPKKPSRPVCAKRKGFPNPREHTRQSPRGGRPPRPPKDRQRPP